MHSASPQIDDPDSLAEQLDELESAEDFLDFFAIPYSPAVVRTNRLHILQRFHDYLRGDQTPDYARWRTALLQAYTDFEHSDALTEGVFRVFKRARGIATVPLSAIGRRQA